VPIYNEAENDSREPVSASLANMSALLGRPEDKLAWVSRSLLPRFGLLKPA
jgi:hypothetical protein